MQQSEINQLLEPIRGFLQCATPAAWVEQASVAEALPIILKDHLVCELKAAQSAMYLLRKYAVDEGSGDALLAWLKPYEDFTYRRVGDWRELGRSGSLKKRIQARADVPYSDDLIAKMVLLIQEELHHFYQVLEMMEKFGVQYDKITSSRYARGLLTHVRTYEPAAFIDKLICGAYIEARSCERFAVLAPHMPPELQKFYISLLRSEARHYQDYLQLAAQIAGQDISERVHWFGQKEAELINTDDTVLRFHSGPVAAEQFKQWRAVG